MGRKLYDDSPERRFSQPPETKQGMSLPLTSSKKAEGISRFLQLRSWTRVFPGTDGNTSLCSRSADTMTRSRFPGRDDRRKRKGSAMSTRTLPERVSSQKKRRPLTLREAHRHSGTPQQKQQPPWQLSQENKAKKKKRGTARAFQRPTPPSAPKCCASPTSRRTAPAPFPSSSPPSRSSPGTTCWCGRRTRPAKSPPRGCFLPRSQTPTPPKRRRPPRRRPRQPFR